MSTIASLTVSLIIGIVSGVISALIFLYFFLSNKRPKIEISGFINKVVNGDEIIYYFKLVNKTNTEIFDVRMEPTFFKPVGDLIGRNLKGTDIQLIDNLIAHIPREKKQDENNLHAFRVRTKYDLENNWIDESSFIRLTVIAKHSLTGLNRVFVKDFLTKECITEKRFTSGNSLGVQ